MDHSTRLQNNGIPIYILELVGTRKNQPMALVYGGNGALGRDLVTTLISKKITVISVDITENKEATHSIIVQNVSFDESSKFVEKSVSDILKGEKLDCVLNVAGGWAGGSIKSEKLIENCEKMISASIHSSIIAGQLAAKHMKIGGLLILPGAYGAISTTPKSIAYGIAKSAVHHLVSSLACIDSGLPDKTTVIGLCPLCLDTPMNRKGLPKADFTNWTATDELSRKIVEWVFEGNRPESGSLIKVETIKTVTSYDVIKK